MKVLVTGASGFVGQAIVAKLAAEGRDVIAATRSQISTFPWGVAQIRISDLGGGANPLGETCSADVVVHAAARVHMMHDRVADSLALYRAVNVEGSLSLARQSRAAGARRFVYLSSIKVLGESSVRGQPLDDNSPALPADLYGVSKLEAERALATFCLDTGMELVVIRPPLVYGPGVKANFERLMRAIARRWPLPFGRIDDNRRSLVGLDNLVDLIAACVGHRAAAGRTFLVSDGEDLSTADLVRRLAQALGVPSRLVPVPVPLLRLAGAALGRRAAVQRLCGSLQVDIDAARSELGWTPPSTVDEGFAKTARHFLRHASA